MLGSVSRIASQEVSKLARSAMRRLVFLIIGLVFGTLALIFGAVALFLWLATLMPAPLAGAAVAGGALVAAIIALLLAGRRGRRREPVPLQASTLHPEEKRMAEAEALGVMLGRSLKGFPLIITALAIGIIVGRVRG